MKKVLLTLLVVIGFMSSRSSAQINVNVNIGSQPLWGPVGYDHVDYYYLPEIESYYYVPQKQFVYLNNGNWAFSNSLPSGYRNYNLYNGYKVVVNSPKPYMHFKQDKVKYAKYKSNHSQVVILKSTNPKYYVVKGHPKFKAKKYVSGKRTVIVKSNKNVIVKKGNNGQGKGHKNQKGKH